MQHKSLGEEPCPIARGLEHVGEWWSILILRDALDGRRRFDEFQRNLPIAPNMLTRRLSALVDAGLLERRRYNEHPARYEYVPTEAGIDFQPVIAAMFSWGRKHYGPNPLRSLFVYRATGAEAEPVVIDAVTRLPITALDFGFARNPDWDEVG
jgi:DNA-binding HxlR family transcriptional regulator